MSRIIKTTFADDGDDRTLGRLADALEAKAPELRKVIGQPEEPDVTPALDDGQEWISNLPALPAVPGPNQKTAMFMQAPPLAAVLRGGPGSGHFGHEGREGKVGGSQPGDFHSSEGQGAESKKRVGITSSRPGKPNAQVFEEMRKFKDRLLALPTVANAEVEPGLGGWQDDSGQIIREPTWVVSYEGNGEAQALLEETAKQYEQDAVLVMGGTDGEDAPMSRIVFGDNVTPEERDAIQTAAAKHGFAGWTWYRDEQGHAVMELVTVPQWGGDVGKHVLNAAALSNDIRAIGQPSEISNQSIKVSVMETRKGLEPPDLHEAEGASRVDSSMLAEYSHGGIRVEPENIPFLEGWLNENSGGEIDPLEGECFVAPSGKAYPVEPLGGHDPAGADAMLALYRHQVGNPNAFPKLSSLINDEDALLANGFLRVTYGDRKMQGSNGVGLSWNRKAGLTPRQQQVAARIGKSADEHGAQLAFVVSQWNPTERDVEEDGISLTVGEWPSNDFTRALHGETVALRSLANLPAWAQRVHRGGHGSGFRVSGLVRRLVLRGGPGSGHFGHEGRPGWVGGSQPGDFHEAPQSTAIPKSVEWHFPESEKTSDDFEPVLYHGTVLEHVEDIARFGLLPQVGEWVTSAYSRPGTNIGKAKVEATYFAGPEGSYGFPESGVNDVQDDSYAWKSIMAIQAQVAFLMDKVPDDVTIEDIRQNGLLVGVKASDLKDADVRVVIESQPEEADEPVPVAVPVSFPDDSTVEVGYDEQELSGVGPERGDYFTTAKVSPSLYLYGDDLVRWMAHFFARHNGGEGMDYDLGADVVSRLGDRYNEDLSVDDAVLDDFPPDDEEEAVEKSSYRRMERVANRTPDRPLPALRVFIPQWLALRGGPGSGHFGHEGRPGQVGGSQPSDFHSAEGQGPKPGDMVDCPRCGGTGYLEHYQHVAEGVCFECGGDKKVPYVPEKKMPEPDKKWVATTQRIANARDELVKELYLPKPGEPITNATLIEVMGRSGATEWKELQATYGLNPKDWPDAVRERWEKRKLDWAEAAAITDKIFQQFGHEGTPFGLAGMFWTKEAKKEKELMEVFDKDPEAFIEQDISKARAAFSAKAQRVSGEQADVDAFFQSWKPPENALTAKLAISVTKHGYDWVKGNKLVKLSVPEASRYSLDNSTKILRDIGARPLTEAKKGASPNWWYIVRPLAAGHFAMHQFSQFDYETDKGPTSEIHEMKRGDWEWKFARPYVLNFIKQNTGG